MALITMRDVTIAFEGVAAIEHVNLSIERGDYLVIVGENGSGNSTLMRAILGLVRPHSGQVLYGDGLRRSQIGYLPQQTAAQRDFPASVEEVVMSGCINRMGRRLFFAPAQRKLAEEKMRMMDVEKFRRKPYRVLSGGQQQRVLLARALCAADGLLMLDEPVSALDPEATEEFYGVLRMLHRERGMAILMISHDVQAAVRDADKVVVLDREVRFDGTRAAYAQWRKDNA